MLSQYEIETLFNKKQLKQVILDDLETMDNWEEVYKLAEQLYANYLCGDYYASKNARMQVLMALESSDVIRKVIATAVAIQEPIPYISVASMCAESLDFEHKQDALLTTCELLAVLSDTGLWEFSRVSKYAQMNLQSCIELNEEVLEDIAQYMYLPPMVSKPNFIDANHTSPWYTIKSDSNILGGFINHHIQDICLDVLNIQNSIQYVLDYWFIDNHEHKFTSDLTGKERQEAERQHESMLKQTAKAVEVIAGRTVYIPNKYDKRGRLYSQGYHINPQGSEYKKAMLNLKATCKVEVPEEFKLG